MNYEGVKKIKILFWNIYKKNPLDVLSEIIVENELDIVAMVECENLDVQALLNELHKQNYDMQLIQFSPENSDIKLLAKFGVKVIPKEEKKRFSTYKFWQNDDLILLTVLHLESALHKEESARNNKAARISRQIEKIEDEVYGETERKGIVIGDFNLQPYSDGIAGIFSFNATMSIYKAKKKYRESEGEKLLFYFNPIWKLMGDNVLVQGSYYNSSDSQDKSIFWYSYDSVLLRPYLIDRFNWDNFKYVSETENHSLMNKENINKRDYSDHLPVKFEIM